jgi:hypothetical protein
MKRNLLRHCGGSLGVSKWEIHRLDDGFLVRINVLWNDPRDHQISHLYTLFSGLKRSVCVLHCEIHYRNSRQDYRDLWNNWPWQHPKRMAEEWISVLLSSGFPCCSYWNLLSLSLLVGLYTARLYKVGRGSTFGITTRYGLDGPGIWSRWRRVFPYPSKTAPIAQPVSCKMGTWSLSRG